MTKLGAPFKVSYCQVPGCGKEIQKGAKMCSAHWRLYQLAVSRTHLKGKPVTDEGVLEAMKELQNTHKPRDVPLRALKEHNVKTASAIS